MDPSAVKLSKWSYNMFFFFKYVKLIIFFIFINKNIKKIYIKKIIYI